MQSDLAISVNKSFFSFVISESDDESGTESDDEPLVKQKSPKPPSVSPSAYCSFVL